MFGGPPPPLLCTNNPYLAYNQQMVSPETIGLMSQKDIYNANCDA